MFTHIPLIFFFLPYCSLSTSPPSQFIPPHTFNLSCLAPTTCCQARMELRRLKQEVLNKHAVTVIWAYWQGTKVFPPCHSVLLSQLSCHPCSQMSHPVLPMKVPCSVAPLLSEPGLMCVSVHFFLCWSCRFVSKAVLALLVSYIELYLD